MKKTSILVLGLILSTSLVFAADVNTTAILERLDEIEQKIDNMDNKVETIQTSTNLIYDILATVFSRVTRLFSGWVLASSPYPSDVSIEQGLSSIDGCYKYLFSYQNEAWKSYNPIKESNSLDKISPDYGYWIKINCTEIDWQIVVLSENCTNGFDDDLDGYIDCDDSNCSSHPACNLLADGEPCTQHSECESNHCQNGYCCASGDCCSIAEDCPGSYETEPVCDSPAACQGHREDKTCISYQCGSASVDDDSDCDVSTLSDECGFYLPVYCSGEIDQSDPECPTSCDFDSDCDSEAHCDGTCEADLPNGEPCDENSDCISGLCSGDVCQEPSSCYDEIKNGDETDTDCGGSCPPCEDGKQCLINADCESGVCSVGGICQAPSCEDAVKNGDETDIDCGGSCPACEDGKSCSTDEDCISEVCTGNICQAPECGDGKCNGSEDCYTCPDDCGPC